MKNMIFKK